MRKFSAKIFALILIVAVLAAACFGGCGGDSTADGGNSGNSGNNSVVSSALDRTAKVLRNTHNYTIETTMATHTGGGDAVFMFDGNKIRVEGYAFGSSDTDVSYYIKETSEGGVKYYGYRESDGYKYEYDPQEAGEYEYNQAANLALNIATILDTHKTGFVWQQGSDSNTFVCGFSYGDTQNTYTIKIENGYISEYESIMTMGDTTVITHYKIYSIGTTEVLRYVVV